MDSRWSAVVAFLMISGFFALLSPCDAPAAGGYSVIIQEQRIPLSESGQTNGKWDARDLSIEYTYFAGGGRLTLGGAVKFADSISYNYDRLPSFYAEVIFGDAQGRVIGSSALMTARQGGSERWEPIRFSRRIPLPPGTVCFAFSYRGEVVEAKGGRGGGNPTSIWLYPVTKAAPGQR
ncbi:MAG: hypothetical protein ABFD97_22765 [Syntrophobacter sp.]